MSQSEWIKKWCNKAPALPEPAVNKALLVLSGHKEGK